MTKNTMLRDLAPTHREIISKRLKQHIELEKQGKLTAHRLIQKHNNRIKLIKDVLKSRRPLEHYQKMAELDLKTTLG